MQSAPGGQLEQYGEFDNDRVTSLEWVMYTLIRERVASMYELSYVYNLDEMLMPLTLIPILAAIWPAIDPIHTLMNNISDLVGTMLIARQLDKVDMNVYNS